MKGIPYELLNDYLTKVGYDVEIDGWGLHTVAVYPMPILEAFWDDNTLIKMSYIKGTFNNQQVDSIINPNPFENTEASLREGLKSMYMDFIISVFTINPGLFDNVNITYYASTPSLTISLKSNQEHEAILRLCYDVGSQVIRYLYVTKYKDLYLSAPAYFIKKFDEDSIRMIGRPLYCCGSEILLLCTLMWYPQSYEQFKELHSLCV